MDDVVKIPTDQYDNNAPHEAYIIMKKIINKFPGMFNNVDLNAILFSIVYKDNLSIIMNLYGVSSKVKQIILLNDAPERYVLEINDSAWSLLSEPQKQWKCMETLGDIGPRCNGDVRKREFIAHHWLVDLISRCQLGSDYFENSALPNILVEDIYII